MHRLAVKQIVASVRRRVEQGDCPIEPPHSREVLEEVIVELSNDAHTAQLRRIDSDPDDEPTAGGPSPNPTSDKP